MSREADREVRELYESSAEWYNGIMDEEIELPIYAELLSGLAARLVNRPGPLLDTSCGTGHMLLKYHQEFDSERQLLGVDLSPHMVEIATKRLGACGTAMVGDMRDLSGVESGSVAALLSFFALHHLDPEEIPATLQEWARALQPGGVFLLATWEGEGAIDYGEESDLVALRYTEEEVLKWVKNAGFRADASTIRPVEGMPMDAIYLEATRNES